VNFNYDTSNLIIFQYPRYAGGKFVINCLGLSDNMVFQRQSFAQAQIDGNFSFEDKKEHILEKIEWEDCADGWSDLRLGCTELFVADDGNDYPDVNEIMHSVYENKQHDGISDTVKYLSQQEDRHLLFPIVNHGEKTITDRYPNAKIIQWKNNAEFVHKRTKSLPSSTMGWDINWIWDTLNGGRADFMWDSNWYNTSTQTLNGIHSLYNLLNLNGWEEVKSFVEEYYYLWIEKIVTPKPDINNRLI